MNEDEKKQVNYVGHMEDSRVTSSRSRRRGTKRGRLLKLGVLLVILIASVVAYLVIRVLKPSSLKDLRNKVSNLTSKEGFEKFKEETTQVVTSDVATIKTQTNALSENLMATAEHWRKELNESIKDYADLRKEKAQRMREKKNLDDLKQKQLQEEKKRKSVHNAIAGSKLDSVPHVPGVMTEDMIDTVLKDKKLGDKSSYAVADIASDSKYDPVDFDEKKVEELKKSTDAPITVFQFRDMPEYHKGRKAYGRAVLDFRKAKRGIMRAKMASKNARRQILMELKTQFETARDEFDKAGRLYEAVLNKALEVGAATPQMKHLNQLMDAYARARNACVEQIVRIERELDTSSSTASATTTTTAPPHRSGSGASRTGNPIFDDPDYQRGLAHYQKGVEIYNNTMAGPPDARDAGYKKALAELNPADTEWTKVMNKYGDDPAYKKYYPAFDDKFSQLAFLIYACRKHKSLGLGLR